MSLLKTHPKLKYKLFHGIRYKEDIIYELTEKNYFKFLSKEEIHMSNFFKGRITENLEKIFCENKDSYIFLCGNSLMVTEIYDKLIDNSFKPQKIFSEVFF